jgi:hypothetical protein
MVWISANALRAIMPAAVDSDQTFEGLDFYGDEDPVLNASGRLVTRVFDHDYELSVSLSEWLFRAMWADNFPLWKASSPALNLTVGGAKIGAVAIKKDSSGLPQVANDHEDKEGPLERLIKALPVRPSATTGGAYDQCGSLIILWDYRPMIGPAGVLVGGGLFYLTKRNPSAGDITGVGGTMVYNNEVFVNWTPRHLPSGKVILPTAQFSFGYHDLDPIGIDIQWSVDSAGLSSIIGNTPFNGSDDGPAASITVEFDLRQEPFEVYVISATVRDRWGYTATPQKLNVIVQAVDPGTGGVTGGPPPSGGRFLRDL